MHSSNNDSLLVYNEHVYLPVYKNASTTYIQFFKSVGWQTIPYNAICNSFDHYKMFGHIQDPVIRYCKGIVELIMNDVITYNADWSRTLLTDVFDRHVNPITMTYRELSQQAHWIPLDLNVDNKVVNSNYLTNLYFERHDLPFRITDEENKHLAHYSKKTLQKICLDYIRNNKQTLNSFFDSRFYGDQKLWETAIRYYSNKYFQGEHG